ncbi:MAG: hypothetical protein K6T34_07670 [Thermoflavifilum sp.]|nr:hypothetical protein [Thermoflavifilum sp.]
MKRRFMMLAMIIAATSLSLLSFRSPHRVKAQWIEKSPVMEDTLPPKTDSASQADTSGEKLDTPQMVIDTGQGGNLM